MPLTSGRSRTATVTTGTRATSSRPGYPHLSQRLRAIWLGLWGSDPTTVLPVGIFPHNFRFFVSADRMFPSLLLLPPKFHHNCFVFVSLCVFPFISRVEIWQHRLKLFSNFCGASCGCWALNSQLSWFFVFNDLAAWKVSLHPLCSPKRL